MNPSIPRFLALLAFASPSMAQPLVEETFSAGIKAWTIESGQAGPGREQGGSLVLKSTKDAAGVAHGGIVSFTAEGLQPNQDYELQVSFRFEKPLPDKWPWAKISIWEPTAKPAASETTSGLIAEKRIATQKQSGIATADNEWRTLSLPFNPGKSRTVVIRLLNHPKMYDQTHWDDIRIVPLAP